MIYNNLSLKSLLTVDIQNIYLNNTSIIRSISFFHFIIIEVKCMKIYIFFNARKCLLAIKSFNVVKIKQGIALIILGEGGKLSHAT